MFHIPAQNQAQNVLFSDIAPDQDKICAPVQFTLGLIPIF